jgi:hypothetical protein
MEAGQRAMIGGMTTITASMKLGAQQTLDELFVEGLIPFKLSARLVESIGMEEYIVRFYDSRLYSVDVSWRQGEEFRAVFRAAMLGRFARLTSLSRSPRTA